MVAVDAVVGSADGVVWYGWRSAALRGLCQGLALPLQRAGGGNP